jgi:hypothetical protein
MVQAADATSAREVLTQLRREGLIAYISDDAPTKIVIVTALRRPGSRAVPTLLRVAACDGLLLR